MTTPTRSRRLIALSLALVATLGLVASACGDDTDDSSKSGTTSEPRESTTTEAESDEPAATESTTTAAKQPFDEGVALLRSKVEDAEGDLCALLGVLNEDFNIEDPQTPEQVKSAIEVLSELFTAVGDAAGEASGEDLKTAAKKLTVAAAAANYETSVFEDGSLYEDSGLSTAITGIMSTAETKCPEMFEEPSASTP